MFNSEGPGRLTHRLIVVAALLTFFALGLDTAGRKAVTTDEPLHLTHAITMRETGVMALPEMHTPLTYRLVASLLATEPPLPAVTTLPSWPSQNPYHISRELVWRDDIHTDRVVWLGRFVVVLMGVLLGALLAAWTMTLTRGHRPALATVMLLYALSPNLLASAGLLTTDMAATLTWFLSIYTWWRYWQRPGRGRWLLAAVALGLALAAKLTGVLLLPVTAALALPYVRQERSLRPLFVWAGMLPVAGLTLWAFYGFEMRGALPMPAYVEAWQLLLTEVDASHANYFMGSVSPDGSWLYLPATLLLKTPLLQLALFALIPFALWRERRRGRTLLFLLLPPAVFLAVSAASRLNYGYRHVLPVVPFLMVLGAMAIPHLWVCRRAPARRLSRSILLVGLGWTAVVALALHPDHLTYFNELAGGQGYRYLGDSNLDWGQDLNQLAAYAARYRAETGRSLQFTYTGMADRTHYGLAGPSLIEQFSRGEGDFAAANPRPGRYAVNVAAWQGVGLILGELRESDLFDWFRWREPDETLGGTVFIYDVTAQAEGDWVAHCAAPGRLLDDAQAEQLLGREGLRHLTFDCRTAWVFPEGPGWFVLPPGGANWLGAWLGDGNPPTVYRHHANAFGPDYAIAYWPGTTPDAAGGRLRPYVGPGGGPAILRGFGVDGAEWATLWLVTEPTSAPLSVKGHLLAADGTTLVADGLGFTSDQWRPGDWFLQRHLFDASGDPLETGLYDYITLESAGPAYVLPAEERPDS